MLTPLMRQDSRRLLVAGMVLAAFAATGCQGGTGIIRRWSMQDDRTLAKPISNEEFGDNRGRLARWLTPEKAPHTGGKTNVSLALAPSKPDPETQAKIDEAESLFQQGKLAEAERAFARLDTSRGAGKLEVADPAFDVKENDGLWSRIAKGTLTSKPKRGQAAWGEKVLFYLAESQYQQGKFVAANDTYEKLLNTYPGSPHLEKAVEREFAIAQDWLKSEPAKTADANAPPVDDAVRQASWLDHFNGRKPTVDVEGYGIKALEHVRQHDPTGPLADDATLAIAEYYMRKADYENASAYFDQLITDHPKGPLLQKGMLGSIDAKMKAYLGPEYDADGLEKARVLIRQVMMAFPERSDEVNKKLENDLNLIADQQAEITFKRGEFYKRTGYVSGAEMSFGEVRARWPKSPWAEKAQVQLASLGKMKRRAVEPSRILTLPGAPDPSSQGSSPGTMGATGGMGGMGAGMPAGAGP